MSDVSSTAPVAVRLWVALDVHKNSIVAATLAPQGGTPELIARVPAAEAAIRESALAPSARRLGCSVVLPPDCAVDCGRPRRLSGLPSGHARRDCILGPSRRLRGGRDRGRWRRRAGSHDRAARPGAPPPGSRHARQLWSRLRLPAPGGRGAVLPGTPHAASAGASGERFRGDIRRGDRDVGRRRSTSSCSCSGGRELPFDSLIVALGARAAPAFEHAVTIGEEGTDDALHGILRDLEQGYVKRLAFVVPSSVVWSLPLYELALLTAADAEGMGIDDAQLHRGQHRGATARAVRSGRRRGDRAAARAPRNRVRRCQPRGRPARCAHDQARRATLQRRAHIRASTAPRPGTRGPARPTNTGSSRRTNMGACAGWTASSPRAT